MGRTLRTYEYKVPTEIDMNQIYYKIHSLNESELLLSEDDRNYFFAKMNSATNQLRNIRSEVADKKLPLSDVSRGVLVASWSQLAHTISEAEAFLFK